MNDLSPTPTEPTTPSDTSAAAERSPAASSRPIAIPSDDPAAATERDAVASGDAPETPSDASPAAPATEAETEPVTASVGDPAPAAETAASAPPAAPALSQASDADASAATEHDAVPTPPSDAPTPPASATSDEAQPQDEAASSTAAPSAFEDAALHPGDVVAGRYRLLEVLGTGGMGTVFLAEHTSIGKRFALKVLAPRFARERSYRQRFALEAKAVSQIVHENVVEVTDFGETETGSPFLVMEYLAGRGLAQWLREEGPLPWPRAQPLFIQICKALHAAHHQGILHRDIKPENCFIVRRGTRDTVKVLDFGLATALDGNEVAEGIDPALGGLVGTIEYMPPEQLRGEPITIRSDLYSVGILMYEVLSGYVPFSGDDYGAVVEQHLHAKPIPLQQLVPEAHVPEAVEAIILRALAKDPLERFASAAELGRALAAIAVPRRSTTAERAFVTRERFYLGVILGLSVLVVVLMLVLAYVAFLG